MRHLYNRMIPTLFLLLCLLQHSHAAGIAKGPYLQNPTTQSITVCWVSDTETVGSVQCDTETDKPHRVLEKSPTLYHRVKVEKLKPATSYAYTVTCDGTTSGGTFRTASPAGRTVRFVAYGDNRTQPLVHTAVLKGIASFNPDFVLQTGDMVANGENLEQWDEYWQIAGPTLRSIPIYPSLGNHERNGAPYFRFFDVPRDYSFDYGDIHFVALDSNKQGTDAAAQMEWLQEDLAKHQKAAWRIVFMHHTLHTCTNLPARRLESQQRNKVMAPILTKGKVRLVISGHDHNYQRHVADGITSLVSGGGGAPLYDLTPDTPFVAKAKKAHHYCEVIADRDRLNMRVVEPDGTVIDEFELQNGKK